MSLEQEAKRNFNSGYNCAESVLLTVSKKLNLARCNVASIIPKIATGFGGGFARNGDICGALSGGIMAISLVLGRDKPDESRDPCYGAVDQFYRDFEKTFGACRCRELTGVDLRTREGSEVYQARIHKDRCNPIVAWAANKAYQIIQESRNSK